MQLSEIQMINLASSCSKIARSIRSLGRRIDGIALTEFAVVTPVFLSLGMVGFEVANLAVTKTRVSQIALSVADNASRLGQTNNTALSPTVSENEVNAVLRGAEEQGKSISFAENGRVILSSLEYDGVMDRQFIHWQRCYGDKDAESAYGNDSDKNGKNGPRLNGMGETGREVTAPPGEAVMFVEVYYDYPAVFSNALTRDITLREEAAFIIRDDRTLTPEFDPDEKGLTGALLNEC